MSEICEWCGIETYKRVVIRFDELERHLKSKQTLSCAVCIKCHDLYVAGEFNEMAKRMNKFGKDKVTATNLEAVDTFLEESGSEPLNDWEKDFRLSIQKLRQDESWRPSEKQLAVMKRILEKEQPDSIIEFTREGQI